MAQMRDAVLEIKRSPDSTMMYLLMLIVVYLAAGLALYLPEIPDWLATIPLTKSLLIFLFWITKTQSSAGKENRPDGSAHPK